MIEDLQNMDNYLVYSLYCIPSNKYYIGLTSKTLEERWLIHTKNKDGFALHNAISKYGKEKFIKNVLKTNLSKEKAQLWEKKYIQLFNSISPNGYNLTKGGEGVGGCLETNLKISEKRKLYFEDGTNKEKQRLIALDQWQDDEFKKKMKKGFKTRWIGEKRENYLVGLQSKENRNKHRIIAQKFWAKKKGKLMDIDIQNCSYWELRKAVSKIVPRMTQLVSSSRKAEIVREKGRKKNYSQFNLREGEWRKQERLLNTEEINSFLEISVRAAACPMPFNMDIWDGLICPYNCIYCFANSFRASLYTAFFDNSKTMGLRHCNPDYYIKELDKMEKLRAYTMEEKRKLTGINKAYALDIPVRMGIRFEDFLRNEGRHGVSLKMLQYLKDVEYPVMINTKSNLVARPDYLKALADNPARTAVHITMISANNKILKALEPGAPSYEERLAALKALNEAGVRGIPRIEPFLYLLTDEREYVEKYMDDIWEAGARHITFDTYSYTANNSGLRQNFINEGYDYDRMFEAGCDSQPFGSLLLGKFMQLFRERGFSCSSFDMGNTPSNDQSICCEVEDWFQGGWNYGSTVIAARFIAGRKGQPTTWKMFEAYVEKHGGFLTEELKMEVKHLWNLEGNIAYCHRWAAGMIPTGRDEDGLIWRITDKDDRETLIKDTL